MSDLTPKPPQSAQASAEAPRPAALKWVTTPLLLIAGFNALFMLMMPFAGDALEPLVRSSLSDLEMEQAYTPEFMQTFVWSMFFMFAIATAAAYFAWEGAKVGRRWAWIVSMLLGVLSLIAFVPVSTLIGLALLFGVFQPSVRAYFNRPDFNRAEEVE